MNRIIAVVVIIALALSAVVFVVFRPQKSTPNASVPVTREVELPAIPVVGEDQTSVDAAVREQIDQARESLEAAPRDARANGHLGMLYELYQSPDAALVCYERASLLDPQSFEWQYLLARLRHLMGFSDESLAALDSALAIRDDYVPAWTLLGDIQFELGALDESKEAHEKALTLTPGTVTSMLGLTRIHLQNDEYDSAIELLGRALKAAPQYSPLHYNIALAYRGTGQTDLAKQHFDLAASTSDAVPDPDPIVAQLQGLRVGAHRIYGQAHQAYTQGRFGEAIRLANEALDADPEHKSAHGLLGMSYMSANQPREAAEAFEQALERNPTNLGYLRHHALIMLQMQNLDAAQTSFEKLHALGGNHPDDHYLYGVLLSQQQKIDEAQSAFEKALERKSDHAQAREQLVRILEYRLAQAPAPEEVTTFLTRLTELNPTDTRNWAALGLVLAQQGRSDEAIGKLEKAIELDPSNEQFKRLLEQVRSQAEKPDDPGR